MTRIVKGLEWAKRLSERPKFIPKSRVRGRKAEGLRYERKLAKAIPGALHGEWFEFEDQEGFGVCQPDLILELSEAIVCLECKYTWTAGAYVQLEGLYRPVLERAFGKRFVGLQVCKVLRGDLQGVKVASGLGNALVIANSGARACWHWLPDTPIRLTPDQKETLRHAA